MDALKYIVEKFGLDVAKATPAAPVEIVQIERAGLAELFCELGFKTGAEVGVEQGKYSEELLKANPGLRLYCVDAWARYRGYRDHVNQEKLDGFYRATEDRLKGHDAVLVRGYSMDVVAKFKKESLDFVYIDANHQLPWVVNDIWRWGERVRSGGIISGHDYRGHDNGPYQCHVIDAVHAWTAAYRIAPWFVVGGKYSEPRPDGKVSKRNRSWFWVKP
jgi:hypothetical protein